jgi:3-oxoacyl-[acyl-carrier protein] reductase
MRMSEEDWDAVLNTNLRGAFSFIKAFARGFIKQRSGRIINIASVIGLIGNAGQCNYAASKSALIGLTKSVAKELASRSITCNALAPGFIETDMTAVMTEPMRTELLKRIPLGTLHAGHLLIQSIDKAIRWRLNARIRERLKDSPISVLDAHRNVA